jgi:hypothetical protein
MSQAPNPSAGPRSRETAISVAYLRTTGSTQEEAANAAGVDRRTVQRWEHSSWWPDVQREATDRWLAGAVGKARRALLRALEDADGALALRVLERVVPELAPARQRVEVGGSVAKLNFDAMTDEQLSRIARGEHPYAVLAPTRDLLGGARGGVNEILQLPPAVDEHSED